MVLFHDGFTGNHSYMCKHSSLGLLLWHELLDTNIMTEMAGRQMVRFSDLPLFRIDGKKVGIGMR